MDKDTKEIWRVIVTERGIYENYLISNLGKVKNIKRGKELRYFIDTEGYCVYCLCKNSEIHKYRLHRLLGYNFITNLANYPEIDHKDTNRQNNSLDNLTWVTHKQNCNNPKTLEKMRKSKRKKEGM